MSVGSTDIAERPMLRPGDLLEFVPGLIATAHSGIGKANGARREVPAQ